MQNEVICIYCGFRVNVLEDFVCLTDANFVGQAHVECQCLAISLASAALALRQTNLITTVPLSGKAA
jgi:hypothetical protein